MAWYVVSQAACRCCCAASAVVARPGSTGVAAIHRWGGHRASHLREGLRRARRGGLEGGSLVMQQGLDGFSQVFDQMKPIHDLDGMRGTTTNAVRIEGTPIPTDDRHRRMLGEPLRHRVCRALRQEVQDAMRLQIDQDRAIALPASPGPLIDPQHCGGAVGGGVSCTSRSRVAGLVRSPSRLPSAPPPPRRG